MKVQSSLVTCNRVNLLLYILLYKHFLVTVEYLNHKANSVLVCTTVLISVLSTVDTCFGGYQISVLVMGVPQGNKFEQVYSDGYQVSLAGGRFNESQV